MILPATKANQIKQPWKHPEHSKIMQASPVVKGLAFRKEHNMNDYIHPQSMTCVCFNETASG